MRINNKNNAFKKINCLSFKKIAFYILFSFFLASLLFTFQVSAAGEKIKIKGGDLDYRSEQNTAVIKGGVIADYGKYHFHADEIIVKMKEGDQRILSTPEDIKMSPGSISGCDYQNPHYMFKASKIKIYPNDYLEAYNVVYYELNGKLPLFYLPYLYISLSDDRQKIMTEFGYSNKRGWYGKLTYNYELMDKLPGQLYLDYYQKTGEAYGFKQHFINNAYHKGYIYYYKQKNKIDLHDLFDQQFATQYNYSKGKWDIDSRLDYKIFSDYDLYKGNLDVSHEKEKQDIFLDTDYQRYEYKNSEREDKEDKEVDLTFERDFKNDLSIDINYNLDSLDYLESDDNDDKDLNLGLNIDKSFKNNLDIGLELNRELDYESVDHIEEENSTQVDLSYHWADNWQLGADYEYEELKEPEEKLKTREAYNTVLTYEYGDFDFETILER